MLEIYGINNDSSLQVLGEVWTREDRLVVFPNVLQHRVSPFKLAQPSKPGHVKVLALFLVDPNITIPSTANIPPQQRDWWAREINKDQSLSGLPQELADLVLDEVSDFPLTMEQAKEVRDELREDRKLQHEKMEKTWNSYYYNFPMV